MSTYRTYKFRLYPSSEQIQYLLAHFQVNRRLYNTLLRTTLSKYHQEASNKLFDFISQNEIKESEFTKELKVVLKAYQTTPFIDLKGGRLPVNFFDYLEYLVNEERKSFVLQNADKTDAFESVFNSADWTTFKKQVTQGAKGYTISELNQFITQWVNDGELEWLSKKWNVEAMRRIVSQVNRTFRNCLREGVSPKFKKKDDMTLTLRRDNKEKQRLLLEERNLKRDTSDSGNIRFESQFLRLPTIGKIRVIKHCAVIGVILNATISLASDGKWFVTLLVSQEEKVELPAVNCWLVIDFNVEHGIRFYDSSGSGTYSFSLNTLSPHQELRLVFLEQTLRRQREVARRNQHFLERCKNYHKNKQKVAKYKAKKARKIEYDLQVLSKQLVEKYDTLILAPQNTQSTKYKYLVRLRTLIRQKALRYGREVIEVGSLREFQEIVKNLKV